ncbi:MAG: cytochrome c [Pseudomonadota bacterium]
MLFGLGQSGLVGIATLGLTLSMAAAAANEAGVASASLDASRQKELVTLVRQDCGSCHGLTLKGGLGPALLPQDLKNKPVEYLTFVILQGRANTAMPPWKRFLSDADAQWIATNLQKGFPDGH